MKKILCLLLMLMVPIMAKPTELLIQKKISHKTKGNLQGYKTVKVDLYAREDLETSLWTETHGSVKFYNGNMTLKVGDVNPLSWELLHSIDVPIIGLTIDGEMVYIKPSAELFSYLADYAEEAGSIDYENIKNVPLISTDMIADRAITFDKLNLTKQDILDLGISSHSESDVLSIVSSSPSDFEKNVNGTFYESIKNTSINNMTSAGYGVSAQNGAISGVFHAHKDINGVGRIQMGSTTNAVVDILQNNQKAIMIDETSVVFNRPFNLNLSGSYSAGDLLVYDGSNWNGFSKGSANQVLGVTSSGLGWMDQTASDYIEGEDKKQYVEVRTTNNTGGSYAGFRASADSGNIKGVFQSHKKSDSGNTVEFGSETNHDVVILRKGKHAVTITLNDDGEIVVKANKLEVENITATSIDATNLSSDSLITSELSSSTSSLGSATSTSLASTDISATGTSSLSSTTVTDFEIIAKKNALSIPAGSILPFAGSVVPQGYLLCDGSSIDAVSSTKYTALWNAIGTTYGGLAKSNFNVPNLKGYFLRGSSDLNSVGTFQSDATAVNGLSASSSSAGEHSHRVGLDMYGSGNLSNAIAYAGSTSGRDESYSSHVMESSGNHTHSISLSGDAETRPMNMSVNYIIKY